jgi:hypothetical protein
VSLTSLQSALWIAETAITFLLCILVFARGLNRRLPLFGAYVALLVMETSAVHVAYHIWGYTSLQAWYVYWLSLGVVLFARALAIAELCWASLRDSPAVWAITRIWLALLALAILIYSVAAAARNTSPLIAFLLTGERGLDLGIVVILLALLGLGFRYKVWIGRIERSIILGFAVYSTFQVLNDTFMQKWMMNYFHWWVSASVVSFEVAMVIWILPLLHPLPQPRKQSPLLSEEDSTKLLGQVIARMLTIADEMKRIARSKWK